LGDYISFEFSNDAGFNTGFNAKDKVTLKSPVIY